MAKTSEERRVKLDLIHSWGSLTNIIHRDSVTLVEDERRMILPVGKYIQIRYIDKQDNVYLRLTDNSEIVSALQVSPN